MTANKRAHQAAYSRPRDFEPPVLSGITRDGFFRLIKRVAAHLPCPPGKAALRTLEEMFEITRPSDWVKPGAEPICYAAQTELAKRADCTDSRIRAHLNELVTAGLIEKRTMGNGRRSGWQDRGIFFTPAIERLEEFRQIEAFLDEQDKSAARLRGLRSTHKRHLNSVIAELSHLLGPEHEDVARLSEAASGWPRADRLHSMSLQALSLHETDADNLCREALDLLRKYEETHGQPVENERSYIQDTTIRSNNVKCNASISISPACKQAEPKNSDTPPDGGVNCLEKDDAAGSDAHKSEFIKKLGPERLYDLASEDMQMYLDIRRHRNGSLEDHDFVVAAQNMLPELGIRPSLWDEAVRLMGEEKTTMCMLILDANRDRPGLPVISPGKYLTGMVRAAEQNKLNIIGSLIGLSERKGKQASE